MEALNSAIGNKANTADVENALENKLDKVTTSTTYRQAYVKSFSGQQEMVNLSSNPAQVSAIVLRDTGGQLNVPLKPTENSHATSKQYVDDSIVNNFPKFERWG